MPDSEQPEPKSPTPSTGKPPEQERQELKAIRDHFQKNLAATAEAWRKKLSKGGNLFGTTQLGGAFGYGTVFRIAADGRETVLHSFNKLDGYDPTGNLAGDEKGNVYGTTNLGGTHSSGVVFKVAPGGVFTALYNFGEFFGDGLVPYAGVLAHPFHNRESRFDYVGAGQGAA
ncbi:MAG: hypothetical protein H0X25_14860 [Acidobacteriales bacterium]|nr:hypothetical protein [Terriglobales bacterium]